MTAHALLVGYVVMARLAELFHARRNTRRLLAAGGYEAGRRHYSMIVMIHAAWIFALAFGVPTDTLPVPNFLIPFVLLQFVRYWIIVTLGERWTTRIIVVPDRALVTNGPYRWVRHPNYMIVIAEILLLPLVFGAWEIALGFTAVTGTAILYRIRIEDGALNRSVKPFK